MKLKTVKPLTRFSQTSALFPSHNNEFSATVWKISCSKRRQYIFITYHTQSHLVPLTTHYAGRNIKHRFRDHLRSKSKTTWVSACFWAWQKIALKATTCFETWLWFGVDGNKRQARHQYAYISIRTLTNAPGSTHNWESRASAFYSNFLSGRVTSGDLLPTYKFSAYTSLHPCAFNTQQTLIPVQALSHTHTQTRVRYICTHVRFKKQKTRALSESGVRSLTSGTGRRGALLISRVNKQNADPVL
jgi:hypothetical protein